MNNRDITLQVDGLELDGRLYLPGDGFRSPCPVVCISHGIPSGQPLDPGDGGYPGLAERICRQGFIVFIYNFRGIGKSGGNLDLPGWERDLRTVVDYLCGLPEADGSHLFLLGFSAGAAVSVCVAAEDNRVTSVIGCACPARMSYDSPAAVLQHFRDIGAVRDADFPYSLKEWQAGFDQVSPIRVVDKLAPRPLLLIHGSDDETVPLSQAYQLYEKAGQAKQMIVIEGAGHRLRQNDRAMNIALDWLKFQSL